MYIILDDFVKYDRFPASVVKHSKTCGGKNENAKVPSRTANCRVSSRQRRADERRSRVCGSTPAHERGFFYLNRRRHPPEWGGSDPLRGFSVSSQGVVARRDHFHGGFFHLRREKVTIPYSSGDFFRPNCVLTQRSWKTRNDPLLIG